MPHSFPEPDSPGTQRAFFRFLRVVLAVIFGAAVVAGLVWGIVEIVKP